MGIWGNPAATKKNFSTHLGGCTCTPPPAYATAVVLQCTSTSSHSDKKSTKTSQNVVHSFVT